MRTELSNIFSLPLPNDVKNIIYSYMYKTYFTIPSILKEDLLTFFHIEIVFRFYQSIFDTDINDINNYLVILYHDLLYILLKAVYVLFPTCNYLNHYGLYIRGSIVSEPFLTKRIKYFWRLLSPNQRDTFIQEMYIKYD